MNIEYNKVTWYSQLAAIILFVAVFFVGFYVGKKYERAHPWAADNAPKATVPAGGNYDTALDPNAMANPANNIGAAVFSANFKCTGGKNINAQFAGNQVKLTLSDGRSIVLPQVISASGARYANANESFVFWNKGKGAFITEDGTLTYGNCLN